jgi:hypothetical protein
MQLFSQQPARRTHVTKSDDDRTWLIDPFTGLQQLVRERPSLFEFPFLRQNLRLAREYIVLPLFGQALGELVILSSPLLGLTNLGLQSKVLFVEELVEPLQSLGAYPPADNRDIPPCMADRRAVPPSRFWVRPAACAVKTPSIGNRSPR